MVEELLNTVEELSNILVHASNFKPHSNALNKFLEVFKRYVLPVSNPDLRVTVRSPLFEKLQHDAEYCGFIYEALRKLVMFGNLYLSANKTDNSYEALRQCWIILNATSLHKSLCKKIKYTYKLVSPLLKNKHRRLFEELSKKYILKPISRSTIVLKFDEVAENLNKMDNLDKRLVHSLNAFFWGIYQRLLAKKKNLVVNNIVDAAGEQRLIIKHDKLIFSVELSMLSILEIKRTKDIELTESKQRLRFGSFGPIVFPGSPIQLGKGKARVSQEDDSYELYEIIQEIAIHRECSECYMLNPTKFIYSPSCFFLVYDDIKFPLSSMICNNRQHPLYDFTPLEAVVVIKSIVRGLHELHKLGFVYNAISMDGILLCIHRDANRQKVTSIKLANFAVNQSNELEHEYRKGIDELTMLEDLICVPPEVHLYQENSSKNDIFAVGMLFWRLMHFNKDLVSGLLQTINHGKKTKSERLLVQLDSRNCVRNISIVILEKKLKHAISQGARPRITHIEESLSRESMLVCIQRCWDSEAARRPSSQELLEILSQMMDSIMPESYSELKVLNGLNDNLRNGENDEIKALTSYEKPVSEAPSDNFTNMSDDDGNESVSTFRSEISAYYHQPSSMITRKPTRNKSALIKRNLTLRSMGSKSDIHDSKNKSFGLMKMKSRGGRHSKKMLGGVFSSKMGLQKRRFVGEIEWEDEVEGETEEEQQESDRNLLHEMEADLDKRTSMLSREQRLSDIND